MSHYSLHPLPYPVPPTALLELWLYEQVQKCLLLFQVFPHFLLLLSLEDILLHVAVAQVPQVPLQQVRIFLQPVDQLIVIAGAVTLAAGLWRS